MYSILPFELKEDFYIRVYFNIAEGYEIAGIKRAYLDFNRTLPLKDKNQDNRNIMRKETELFLKTELLGLVLLDFENQEEYDSVHKELCLNLIRKWDELSVGKAQKWINMTLKYWLLFGENRIKGIEKNARFFHIPIDNLIQKNMFGEKSPKPWSRINNYDDYFEYQLKHRAKNEVNPPIICEFKVFNKTVNL
jgi:hypothetical protein